MPKGIYILSISILLSACCQVTKTYEAFSDTEKSALVYPEGKILNYLSFDGDTIQLITNEEFIGNKPSLQEEAIVCDVYYPAYGSIDLSLPNDSLYFFRIAIKKDYEDKGFRRYINYSGFNYFLDDSIHVTFIDTLLAKGIGPYYNVYKIQTDSSLIDTLALQHFYYNQDKGIFRLVFKNSKLYTLSE